MGRAGDRWRRLVASAAIALVALGSAASAGAQDPGGSAPTTTTTAPTTSTTADPGGPTVEAVAPDAGAKDRPVTAALEALASMGYQETEAVLAGTAASYAPRGMWGTGGHWSVSATGQDAYRTRLLIRRPADPAAFSGTVYVSWLNVAGSFDTDPEWARMGAEVMREGAAWVGVSAQWSGVEGRLGAKAWDPERYGSLRHPGDAASYDIFTQAAQAIRRPGATDPLAGLSGTRRLIATGQSQSAQRLVTYINAFQPTTKAFDGYLVVSRFRGAAPLGPVVVPNRQDADPDGPESFDPLGALFSGPQVAKLRDDTSVPVLVVLTETEAKQDRPVTPPDSATIHTWEVAGSSHFDITETASFAGKLERDFPKVSREQLECDSPNAFPTHYALRAATRALATWVADGAAPKTVPLIERDPATGALVRDADGNARGGVRLPQIAVPTASHTGESTDDGYCGLVGQTRQFKKDALAERYPTPTAYVDALSEAIDQSIAAGHLLREDATELLAATPVPGSTATAAALSGSSTSTSSTAPAPGGQVAAPGGGSTSGQGATNGSAEVPVQAQSNDRSWMATTGRDLITPFLGGLLLLLNGRVVLTIARQRRRSGT